MTKAAKKLLDEFDSLSEEERALIVAELLRRAALSDHGSPSDADLTSAADEVFGGLDRRERQ